MVAPAPKSIRIEIDVEQMAREIASYLESMLRKEGIETTTTISGNKIIINVDLVATLSKRGIAMLPSQQQFIRVTPE
jgi:predicted RNA-binding protein Jag